MLNKLYDQTVLWQMSAAERAAIFYVIDRLPQRRLAIEIGSYKGGLTKNLDDLFSRVISIDIDHSNIVDKEGYCSTEWITESSVTALPRILATQQPNLIIVDGDHSYLGVKTDLQLLSDHLQGNCIVLVHDAAYHESKKALQEVDWMGFKDLDFVPGIPFKEDMIGGLACFIKGVL